MPPSYSAAKKDTVQDQPKSSISAMSAVNDDEYDEPEFATRIVYNVRA